MHEYTVGSLFAGVGGICLGFQQAKNNKAKYKRSGKSWVDNSRCSSKKELFLSCGS